MSSDTPQAVASADMSLYHYTCLHSSPGILGSGLLIPNAHPLCPPAKGEAPLGFVWLTDLAAPDRYALGLTSNVLACDRTHHRFEAAAANRAHRWSQVRETLPRPFVDTLESAPGVQPSRWWVSLAPVAVVEYVDLTPTPGRTVRR